MPLIYRDGFCHVNDLDLRLERSLSFQLLRGGTRATLVLGTPGGRLLDPPVRMATSDPAVIAAIDALIDVLDGKEAAR